MKKTLSMLLAGAMLAAALTGCGSSASTGSDNAADRRKRNLRQRLQERRTDRG